MVQISNYLFTASLILLIGTIVYKGLFRRGLTGYRVDENSGASIDLQLNQDARSTIQRQDSVVKGLLRSYIVWLSLAGILASILITI